MTTTDNHSNQHAVVIGASVSGLLAARVLADHYASVTVIASDTIPAVLLASKRQALDSALSTLQNHPRCSLRSFMPSLTKDVDAQTGREGVTYRRRVTIGLATATVSRPFLEAILRAQLRAVPHVRIVDHSDEPLTADVIVDATNRRLNAPPWLEVWGAPRRLIASATLV